MSVENIARTGLAALSLTFALAASGAAEARSARHQSPPVYFVKSLDGGYEAGAFMDKEIPPASLAKMMTLVLLFEALERHEDGFGLDSMLTVSSYAATRAPSNLPLRAGDEIRVEDAILALIIKSANNIASAVAEKLGGTEQCFAVMMTQKARAIGMHNTVFRNASGLPAIGQHSTPRDLTRLIEYIYQSWEKYMPYFSRTEFRFGGNTIRTHNGMVRKYGVAEYGDDGAEGMKTGYTNASRFNLAASFNQAGQRIIGVIMRRPSASDAVVRLKKYFDAGFSALETARARVFSHIPVSRPAERQITALE